MSKLISLLKIISVSSFIAIILYLGFSIIAWDFTWISKDGENPIMGRFFIGLIWILIILALIILNISKRNNYGKNL